MTPLRIIILQACIPDYRVPLFERLAAAMPGMLVASGEDYFTPNLALHRQAAPWKINLENRFLFDRSLLWQTGLPKHLLLADVVVAEFNPRILSTWVLLVRRRLAGRRTLLWGHLWGQKGPQWITRALRLMMLQLSDGMICYTRSQAGELAQILPNCPAWTASNSCVTRSMCGAESGFGAQGCIAYVGRLIKDKKPVLLLEAFAKVRSKLPASSRLLIAGHGEELPALKNRVKELGLGGMVELLGHVSDPMALRQIYARSRVAVSPGYVGLSAIQAMAYGVPMLISRDEPHSPEIEACVENQTCVFFTTDQVEDLAGKLESFFAPDSPWPSRRGRISDLIAKRYTYDGMVETFQEAVGVHPEGVAPTVVRGLKAGTERHARLDAKVAIVWAQLGPYHLARIAAVQRALGEDRVFGVEIANKTSIYAWERGTQLNRGLVTLLPDGTAEELSAWRIYEAALRFFRKESVDVVFVPSYWPASSFAVMLAARNAGARIVMMNESHALTAKARGIWAEVKRWLVLRFDSALVGGMPHREYFESLGMPPERVVEGYDAVDNDFFAARSQDVRSEGRHAATRARHGLPARYFLNVGRMVWKKNLETLIDAYRLVKNRIGPDCPALVLVGGGALENALRERCLKLGLSVFQTSSGARGSRHGTADVYFFGFRQVDELPDFYALADCFILPSREEEWGLVVNEAMACRLPVLVSSVAGCARNLVREGENGFLFDPFDVEALSKHLEFVAKNPASLPAMGRVSQEIVARWGCERFAEGALRAASIALGGAHIVQEGGLNNA